MKSCGPGTEILVPILTHDERGTSINVLLHPYLRDALSSSFTASKYSLFYFTADLALARLWTTSVIASVRCYTPAVTHYEIMPRYPTIGLFSQVIYQQSSCVRICLCNSFQNQALFFTRKRSFTWKFLFSNARWLFDNFQLSKQSVSVTLNISLNIYRQLFC